MLVTMCVFASIHERNPWWFIDECFAHPQAAQQKRRTNARTMLDQTAPWPARTPTRPAPRITRYRLVAQRNPRTKETPMSTCQHCTRRTELYLCTPCAHTLGDLLAELPWLLYQLDVTITRQDRLTRGGGSHQHQANPNPLNVGAMELARSAAVTLHQIAVDASEVHHSERIPALVNASPPRIAAWLRTNLGAIQKHSRAGEHYRVIAELVGETRDGAIHHAINRVDTRFAGPCPTIRTHDRRGTPLRCGTMLYAHDGDAFTTCPRCQTEIDVEDNRRRTAAANDLLPEQLLLEVLDNLGEHVPRVTFYAWVTSGKLKPRGYLTRTGIKGFQSRRTDPRVYSLTIARQLRLEHRPQNDNDAQPATTR